MNALFPLLLFAASAAAPGAQRGEDSGLPAQFTAVRGEKGLFVGSIPVCREIVARVDRVADPGGSPALHIAFTPAAAARLRTETAALVGRRMSVRIDGRTVMAPRVNEEIAGGTVEISGQSPGRLREIRRAALRRC